MAYNTDGSKTGINMDLSLQNYDNTQTALSFIRSTAQPSISLVKDLTTTPNGIAMNPTGLAYNNGTTTTSTTWDDLSTRIAQLSAVAPNGLNATLLAVNNTISVQNADTAPTRVINTSAEDGTGGTHFGVAWVGNTLPFVMETLDATNLQIKDTTLELKDTLTPLLTTMTASTLTSGASSASWATIIAGGGGAGTLQQTLDLGNTATGANATIGLTNSGVGGLANPSLVLTNSNATINTIPTIELNKTGRNLTAGESVGSISMYGLDAVAQKTEFARIQTKTENVASGNEDGTLSIFNSVNGVISETFNFNGGQNDNNSFRPLDLNGNALRTGSGNLPINATTSSGSGHIDITAKTGSVINLDANININSTASTGTGNITAPAKGAITLTAVSGSTTLPVNSLALSSGDTITLTNGNEANGLPENIIQMTSATTGTNNQIAMEVNDDSSSVYSRFFFGLQGSQFSICEGGGAGDSTNVWDIPANNIGDITLYRNIDFTYGSVMTGYRGVLEKSLINSTTTGTLDITNNRFNTTILTPTGALIVNITTPMAVGQWWGICNKSTSDPVDIHLNGVFQISLSNANALVGSTIRVGASSTTALYIV